MSQNCGCFIEPDHTSLFVFKFGLPQSARLAYPRNPRLRVRFHGLAGVASKFEFYLEMDRSFLRNEQTREGAMNLGDILSAEQIIVDLKAVDRWQAIDELIDQLIATGKIKAVDRSAIISVVRKRESSMSTGIGFGIGIPHASTDLLTEVVGVMGRSKKGVNFDALDNQPVNLIMLFLVPQGQFQKHLHTLANIAKLLHRREFRKALEDAPTAADMFRIIRSESTSK